MEKAKGHQYSVWLIQLAVHLGVHLNLSYRQVQEVLKYLCPILNIEKVPSYGSIRNWSLKLGLAELENKEAFKEETSWNLILDESAVIGREKILLILGTPLSKPKIDSSLSFKDVVPLFMETKTSWTKETVAKALEKVENSLKGKIEYVVSDRGSILTGALKLRSLEHVPDITHHLSNSIEYIYKEDPDFIALKADIAQIRIKNLMGKDCFLAAPNMRTKSRFLNLYAMADWLKKVLNNFAFLSESHKEKLQPILNKKELCKALIIQCDWIRKLSKLFKNKGLRKNAIREARQIMTLPQDTYPSSRYQILHDRFIRYLNDLFVRFPTVDRLIICSDIIESFFGKFKYRKSNTSKSISTDMLVMNLFGKKLDFRTVKQGLQKTKLRMIDNWKKENTVPSISLLTKYFWKNIPQQISN